MPISSNKSCIVEAARKTTERIAKAPDNPDYQTGLKAQLAEILEDNQALRERGSVDFLRKSGSNGRVSGASTKSFSSGS